MRLPESAQELADVIGTERALYLIGQLPRSYRKRNGVQCGESTVVLYVPKAIQPTHQLVQLIGWHDAQRLVKAFGGEILKPATCSDVYRRFRDASIIRLAAEGMKTAAIAEWMEVSERHVRNLLREKPQEELSAANDNTSREPISHLQARR